MEPGKYVLLKDPNKATLKVYAVPLDAFEGDEDEEEDDDEYDEYDDNGSPGEGGPATEEDEDEGPDVGGSTRQFSAPPQPGAK